MSATARDLRLALRTLHLITGALLATYVYLPPGSATWLRWLLMVFAVPAITVSGVWMWKQAAIRRLIKQHRPRAARGLTAAGRRKHPMPTPGGTLVGSRPTDH